MARIKNQEGNFKAKVRSRLPETKRTSQRNSAITTVKDREDIDETEDIDAELENELDAEYETEEEEELEEDMEEEEGDEEQEEEEHVAGSSLTRRRHHAREQVNRVGRVKTRHSDFSSNGHKTKKEVSLRGRSNGSRTERRRELTVPARAKRTEASSVASINRVRATSKTQATVPVPKKRNEQSAKSGGLRRISGNGHATSGRFTDKTSRSGKSKSTTPTSRRRER